MGVIKKQAFQSSVILYTGTLIGFLTTGLLAPHLLTKSEIGTLRLLLSYSGIFAGISVLGFGIVTIRFVPRFYDKVKNSYNGFLGISLLVGTIGFVISLALILLIRPEIIRNNLEKSPQFAHYFFLIIPLTFFQVYYNLFDAYNNALYRSSFGVFLRDFVQRMLILVGLILIFLNIFDFDQYVYYYVTAISLPTVLIWIHLVSHKSFDIRINFSRLNKPLIVSMISVAFFGLLNSFGSIAAIQVDAIMLNMFLDASAVGVYVVTFYFGTLVLIPAKALNKIAPTLISKAFKEDDLETVSDIYYRSTANLFVIGLLVYLGLLVNLENIFNIIPRSYEEGKLVIVLIGFANLIKMAAGSNDSVITYSKYYKMTTAFLIIFLFLIVLFNYLLIPLLGMTGAALATMLAILSYNLIKSIFIRMKFGFFPYSFQFIIVMVLGGIIYLIVSYLPDIDNFIIEILVDSIVTTLLYYLFMRKLPIFTDINQMILKGYEKAAEFFRTKFK